MKKYIALLFLLLILTGCSKNNDNLIEVANIDSLKENIEKIDKVTAITITESGKACYDITSSKTDLYMSLINMKVTEETNEVTEDSTIIYEFSGDNISYSFEFNNGNYVQKNKYYKVQRDTFKVDYNTETPCN